MHHHIHHLQPWQQAGAFQHMPQPGAAAIALTFIAVLIILCFRAGSRRGSRD